MTSDEPSRVVAIKVLPHAVDVPLPEYATSGSSGVDLCAASASDVVLEPSTWTLIPTGIALSIPSDMEAQIRPRSGLALRSGVTVLNSPGTIDSDYRGEVNVMLVNLSSVEVSIHRGDRIAQMIFAPIVRIAWRPVDDLDATVRSDGGFGHTGT